MNHLTPAEKKELQELRVEAARLERRQSDLARRAARAPSVARSLNQTADALKISRAQAHRIQRIALMKLHRNAELRELLNIL